MGAEFDKVFPINMVELFWIGRESFGRFQFISDIRFEGIGVTVDAFRAVRETLDKDGVLDVGCSIYTDPI